MSDRARRKSLGKAVPCEFLVKFLTKSLFSFYQRNHRKIVTCGSSDGDVRTWQGIGDDDPLSFCVGETAVCCAQYLDDKKPRLIVAVDCNLVQGYSFPEGDRDGGVVFRFTAPVTAIRVNKKVS